VVEFRLRENAGLRRFSYPVRAQFPATVPASRLRLIEAAKPVPAQFTQMAGSTVEVDFNASLAPWETRPYRIEEGAGPSQAATMMVEERGNAFVVKHPNGLEFVVPRALLGLVDSVRSGKTEWLRPGSFGLGLTYGEDIRFRGGGINHWGAKTNGTVAKNGPLACSLLFEGKEGLRGSREVASVVEMQFPRSKSWVEVTWTLADLGNFVSGMSAEINLAVGGERTLVDFGAGTTLYAALHANQEARLIGRYLRNEEIKEWSVDVGGEPYASGRSREIEGWAHAMDSTRATAVALAGFGRSSARGDSITVSANGRLLLRREQMGGTEKVFKFWLHFVSMPVQVGAATSPQSMASPLILDWI
jgi:hypothetical protein